MARSAKTLARPEHVPAHHVRYWSTMKLGVIVLWGLVLSSGILVGASLLERATITPLWAGSPPESVVGWPYGAIQKPFFIVATPPWALLSLAVLVVSFLALPDAARPWARVAGAIGIGVMIWTLVFFVPILDRTEGNRGAGLSGDEIARLANRFVTWGYVRTAILAAGWIAAIRALILASGGAP